MSFAERRGAMKRFLLDNDGSNIFHNLGDDVEAVVAETVRECPSSVSTYLLCSGAGSCYWPTKIGDVDPRAEGLLAAPSGCQPASARRRVSGTYVLKRWRSRSIHSLLVQ